MQPLVAVIATGGTIASRRGDDGANRPALTGEDLLAALPPVAARLRVIDLMAKDSSSLTLADMQRISDAVKMLLADPAIDGVVVTHGTDSMEETALLVHLQNGTGKPVVFTGAQFTADRPEADGTGKLAAALRLAADPATARQGVVIAFGGRVLPVWGAFKYCSDDADAFRTIGKPDCMTASPHLAAPADGIRVDLVAIHPGCEATHIEASLQAGADGIVLAGLGSGNATPPVVAAVRKCTAARVPVVVSSRVPTGLLAPAYGGGGGGHDLAAAGAIHARTLRPGQARILLAALLANRCPAEKMAALFADKTN